MVMLHVHLRFNAANVLQVQGQHHASKKLLECGVQLAQRCTKEDLGRICCWPKVRTYSFFGFHSSAKGDGNNLLAAWRIQNSSALCPSCWPRFTL